MRKKRDFLIPPVSPSGNLAPEINASPEDSTLDQTRDLHLAKKGLPFEAGELIYCRPSTVTVCGDKKASAVVMFGRMLGRAPVESVPPTRPVNVEAPVPVVVAPLSTGDPAPAFGAQQTEGEEVTVKNVGNTDPTTTDRATADLDMASDAVFDADPATNMLMLGASIPMDLHGGTNGGRSDDRFTFPDEEPVDDEDYFQFSPRHGVVRTKPKGVKAPITSHTSHNIVTPRGGQMVNQMTLPPALIRKQLEVTLKRLAVVIKEKSALQEQLDQSGLAARVDSLHGLVEQKHAEINWLVYDNRSLQKTVRNQAKTISELEKREQRENPGKVEAAITNVGQLEKQLAASAEKLRRVLQQLAHSRQRERSRAEQLSAYALQCNKQRGYIIKLVKAQNHAQTQPQVPPPVNQQYVPGMEVQDISSSNQEPFPQYHELEGSLGDGIDDEAPGESAPATATVATEPQDSTKGGSIETPGYDIGFDSHLVASAPPEATMEAQLKLMVTQLQRALGVQKSAYLRDIAALKAEVGRLQTAQRSLQQELSEREKEARSHVLTVKQLRCDYEGIAEGQVKLMNAAAVAVGGSLADTGGSGLLLLGSSQSHNLQGGSELPAGSHNIASSSGTHTLSPRLQHSPGMHLGYNKSHNQARVTKANMASHPHGHPRPPIGGRKSGHNPRVASQLG